jgi:hypothetical protein
MVGGGLLGPQGAVAESAREQAYHGLKPIPDLELATIRGGLRIGGLDLDFGAIVKVFVDGTHVATTTFVLNNSGGMDSQTTWGTLPSGVTVSPFMHDGPVGLNQMDGFTIAKGDSTRSFALSSIGLSHTNGAVINTINGVSVKQTIDATLTINNFSAVQSRLLKAAAATRAGTMGAPNAIFSLGN